MTNNILLEQIAHARSGDKGNHANIGVVAYTQVGFKMLEEHLSAELVQNHFALLGATRVERFKLPRVWALNFVLYNALAGGASQSLRIDSQGKLLGIGILDLELQKPDNLAEMLKRNESRPKN